MPPCLCFCTSLHFVSVGMGAPQYIDVKGRMERPKGVLRNISIARFYASTRRATCNLSVCCNLPLGLRAVTTHQGPSILAQLRGDSGVRAYVLSYGFFHPNDHMATSHGPCGREIAYKYGQEEDERASTCPHFSRALILQKSSI